jgi:hypothetical protein
MKQCEESGCPVVEHVSGEVTVSFGWRQFNSTAPVDIRTRGVQAYIDTMPGTLEEAMRFGEGTAIPDTTGIPGGGDNGPGDPRGSVSASADRYLEPCACTCEELADTDAAAVDFKKRMAAGEEPSMAEISGFSRCASSCQREYMVCRMEQADAEKQAEQQEQDLLKGTPESCDCGCEKMAANNQRARELEQVVTAGGVISTEDIISLTRCAEVCQQQHMACMMEQR